MADHLPTSNEMALDNPDQLRSLLEQAMSGTEAQADIDDFGELISPADGHHHKPEISPAETSDKRGQAKGDKTRSPFRVKIVPPAPQLGPVNSDPLPPEVTTKPESPGEDAAVSLPGTPPADEAPEAESSSGVIKMPVEHESTRVPASEMEAFEMYLLEEVGRRIGSALADTRVLAEDRYTSVVATITRLQRRIEVLEQRASVAVSRPRSVDVTGKAPPVQIPGSAASGKQPASAPALGTSKAIPLVRRLIGNHPTPPTMVVKKVYLSSLMSGLGHTSFRVSSPPTDKEWTEKGLLMWVERQIT